MGHSLAASRDSYTGGHSHPSSLTLRAIFIAILQATQWCNTSSTFIIDSEITKLSLLYSRTSCTTALYNVSLA